MNARTGYALADRVIEFAESRGLNVEVKGDGFVVVNIDNRGKAGANGLNDGGVTMYVSFAGSARGRWAGARRWSMIGSDAETPRKGGASDGARTARLWVELLYVTAANTTDADRERQAAKDAEYQMLMERAGRTS